MKSNSVIRESASGPFERFSKLPEVVVLPDGREFTNAQIVSLKRRCKHVFDWESLELLKLISKHIEYVEVEGKEAPLNKTIKKEVAEDGEPCKANIRSSRRYR